MTTERQTCPPSSWEREYYEDWEQALGMTAQAIRETYNLYWKEQKERNRQDNLAKAHGVFVDGIYYHHGTGQKRG